MSGAVVAAVALGVPVWIQRAADFAGYVRVGELVLAGRDIYREAPPGINTWPPFFSLLCAVLALLSEVSPYLARGLWVALNGALLVLVLRLLGRLVYGPATPAAGLLVPLLLTARYVLGNFEHLQVNLVLFALALGGLYLDATRREAAGGVLIGLAAALKVMPLALLAYLALRRRWRAAVAGGAAALVFSLSPTLLFGAGRFAGYLADWRAAVATGWAVGRMNQSVPAMWDRLLGHGLWPLVAPPTDDLAASGAAAARVAVSVSAALVAAAALVAGRGRPRPGGWAALAEWSAVLLAAATFGPVAWKSYLVVALLPNTLLFAAARSTRLPPSTRAGAAASLAVAFLLGGLPAPGLVGRPLAGRIEMASGVTVAALVLLGGVLCLRRRLGAGQGQPPGPGALATAR